MRLLIQGCLTAAIARANVRVPIDGSGRIGNVRNVQVDHATGVLRDRELAALVELTDPTTAKSSGKSSAIREAAAVREAAALYGKLTDKATVADLGLGGVFIDCETHVFGDLEAYFSNFRIAMDTSTAFEPPAGQAASEASEFSAPPVAPCLGDCERESGKIWYEPYFLRDGHCVVFLGDSLDGGSVQVPRADNNEGMGKSGLFAGIATMVDLKIRYPSKVALILGNRDANKLRLFAELSTHTADIEAVQDLVNHPTHVKAKDGTRFGLVYWAKGDEKLHEAFADGYDRAALVEHIFSSSMATQDMVPLLVAELAQAGLPFDNDLDAVDSYYLASLTTPSPVGAAMRGGVLWDFLMQSACAGLSFHAPPKGSTTGGSAMLYMHGNAGDVAGHGLVAPSDVWLPADGVVGKGLLRPSGVVDGDPDTLTHRTSGRVPQPFTEVTSPIDYVLRTNAWVRRQVRAVLTHTGPHWRRVGPSRGPDSTPSDLQDYTRPGIRLIDWALDPPAVTTGTETVDWEQPVGHSVMTPICNTMQAPLTCADLQAVYSHWFPHWKGVQLTLVVGHKPHGTVPHIYKSSEACVLDGVALAVPAVNTDLSFSSKGFYNGLLGAAAETVHMGMAAGWRANTVEVHVSQLRIGSGEAAIKQVGYAYNVRDPRIGTAVDYTGSRAPPAALPAVDAHGHGGLLLPQGAQHVAGARYHVNPVAVYQEHPAPQKPGSPDTMREWPQEWLLRDGARVEAIGIGQRTNVAVDGGTTTMPTVLLKVSPHRWAYMAAGFTRSVVALVDGDHLSLKAGGKVLSSSGNVADVLKRARIGNIYQVNGALQTGGEGDPVAADMQLGPGDHVIPQGWSVMATSLQLNIHGVTGTFGYYEAGVTEWKTLLATLEADDATREGVTVVS